MINICVYGVGDCFGIHFFSRHSTNKPLELAVLQLYTGDYCIEAANRHFKCPLVQSMAFWREPLWTDCPPDPGTYTLPRLMGPNTAYTSTSRCYSLRGRSQRSCFDEDFAKVTLIKPQAPACTFGIRHSIYTTPLIAE